MEVEIRLPVNDLGKLSSILIENGFENLFVRTVPLSRGIEWTTPEALALEQRTVNVLVRKHPIVPNQIELPVYSKPSIGESYLALPAPEPETPTTMPPASMVYDIFNSPERKVGRDDTQVIALTTPIIKTPAPYNKDTTIHNMSLRPPRAARPVSRYGVTPIQDKRRCNICGVNKKSLEEKIKHCMLHYNIKRYKCSICGVLRKQLNFRIHFEKVCPKGTVIDLLEVDRDALVEKTSEMFSALV